VRIKNRTMIFIYMYRYIIKVFQLNEYMYPNRPDQQQQVVNKFKYHFKSTLREISLEAVIEHQNHLVLSRGEGLRNLREK
jgi:hypothetical protein